MFRSPMERAGVSLVVDCPPMKEPAWVDRQMWDKIVLNLVSNAFKDTLRGEVRIELRAVGERFVMEVMDTGAGLSEAQRDQLFNPFSAVIHPSSRSRRGLGLGLAISRAFLESHRGSIHVVSEPGKGTHVIVSIPRGKAHLPPDRVGGREGAPWSRIIARAVGEEAQSWSSFAPSGSAASGFAAASEFPPATLPASRAEIAAGATPVSVQSSKRVIIAEDNREMRAYLVDLLGRTFAPETVSDIQQALASMKENPPDLILAEASLPGANGLDLLLTLRQDPASGAIPVILMMDEPNEELRLRALAAGASDCLFKPFSARELLLRTHLQIVSNMRRR
jgi:CheY-like chemotaxis protein